MDRCKCPPQLTLCQINPMFTRHFNQIRSVMSDLGLIQFLDGSIPSRPCLRFSDVSRVEINTIECIDVSSRMDWELILSVSLANGKYLGALEPMKKSRVKATWGIRRKPKPSQGDCQQKRNNRMLCYRAGRETEEGWAEPSWRQSIVYTLAKDTLRKGKTTRI